MQRKREGSLAWQSPSTQPSPEPRAARKATARHSQTCPEEKGSGFQHQPTLLNHATVGLFPTFGGSIVFRIILLLLAQVTAEPNDRDERVK